MSAFDQYDRLVKMKVTSESIKEISDEDLEVLGEIYADDQFGTHSKTMRIVTVEIARRYADVFRRHPKSWIKSMTTEELQEWADSFGGDE